MSLTVKEYFSPPSSFSFFYTARPSFHNDLETLCKKVGCLQDFSSKKIPLQTLRRLYLEDSDVLHAIDRLYKMSTKTHDMESVSGTKHLEELKKIFDSTPENIRESQILASAGESDACDLESFLASFIQLHEGSKGLNGYGSLPAVSIIGALASAALLIGTCIAFIYFSVESVMFFRAAVLPLSLKLFSCIIYALVIAPLFFAAGSICVASIAFFLFLRLCEDKGLTFKGRCALVLPQQQAAYLSEIHRITNAILRIKTL